MFIFHYMSDLYVDTLSDESILDLSTRLVANHSLFSPDYLVLCGNICDAKDPHKLYTFLDNLVDYYTGIIYVPGSYEFGNWSEHINSLKRRLYTKFDNVYFLYNTTITLKTNDDTCIVGGTPLWYKPHVSKVCHILYDPLEFIQQENIKAEKYLKDLSKINLLITYYGVTPGFTDITDEIERLQPDYILHGNIPTSSNYYIEDTVILCNYYGAGYINKNFNFDAYIKIGQ